MAISPGHELELLIEKPASGGRMIARQEGEVLLVAGAIPGERVLARVTRAEKRVAFASTVRVLERSPDRRDVEGDPACGGCLYAFVEYPRQLQLKSEIIRDAFARIGHIQVDGPIAVQGSPERAYRMRARFHVRAGKVGFYREGTHELCDARESGQLLDGSVDAVESAVASLTAQGLVVSSVELSENLPGDQRAVHVALGHRGNTGETQAVLSHRRNTGETQAALGHRRNTGETQLTRRMLGALETAVGAGGLTGCTARGPEGAFYSVGDPIVSDPLSMLAEGRALDGALRRHPEAFFQANRFLIGRLVGDVLDRVPEGTVLDLYAGVGLFSVALGAAGRGRIIAVEDDPVSSRDLQRNAAPFGESLRVVRSSVEAFLARGGQRAPQTLIVDPPRTGLSKAAADAIAHSGAERILYVSCDPPTMARDARRLIETGYRVGSLQGFDLFPNTPHVETLGVFET